MLTAPFAAVAYAHDSWLVPSSHAPRVGESLRVAFVTGEVFPISDSATRPERVAEWLTVDHRARSPVSGFHVDQQELVALIDPRDSGDLVIAVRLIPRFIELEPDAFNRYLHDERAEETLRSRKDRAESERPGRELYTKLAKTFVRPRGSGDLPLERQIWARPVGHPLEILPLSDPHQLRAGDILRVRVLHEGKPATHRWVFGGHEGLPAHTFAAEARSDSEGIAELKLSSPGRWYLRTHQITRPSGHATADAARTEPSPSEHPPADWQSLWASITFSVAAR